MAASGLAILLLVGIIFMVANAVKIKAEQVASQQQAVIDDVGAGTEGTSGVKIIYKYLPLDLDAFYRSNDMNTPGKLFYSMFASNADDLTQRT